MASHHSVPMQCPEGSRYSSRNSRFCLDWWKQLSHKPTLIFPATVTEEKGRAKEKRWRREMTWGSSWSFPLTSPHSPLSGCNPLPTPAESSSKVLLQSIPICHCCHFPLPVTVIALLSCRKSRLSNWPSHLLLPFYRPLSKKAIREGFFWLN